MVSNDEIVESEAASTGSGSRKKTILISIQAVMFLLGLSLLAFVIYKIGYESVFEAVSRVGWGFFVVIALNQSRHFLRALTMYLAVAPENRTFKYRSAVAARLGGDAMNLFSFAGPFLGDATKAVLLRKNVSLTQGVSAVIIDNILYYVTVIIVILAGVVTLLVTVGSSSGVMDNVLLTIAIAGVILFLGLTVAILSKVTPVTHAIDFFARRNFAPAFLFKKRQNILDVENNVFKFYHDRRADFFKVFGISLFVHVISVTEVYAVLTFLDEKAYISTAFIVESLVKVINATFSFIPGVVGVYESGTGLILNTLGYSTAFGVALALVRRGANLFSASVGLIIVAWRAAEGSARRISRTETKAP